MRKNLGNPKTSTNLEDFSKDDKFSTLRDNEHLDEEVTRHDAESEDEDYENEVSQDPQATTSSRLDLVGEYVVLNDKKRKMYGVGENMIEKISYLGDGGLGPKGKGPWYPICVPNPPQPSLKLVIGDEPHQMNHHYHFHQKKLNNFLNC